MSKRGRLESELIDTGTAYADGADVFANIRNKRFEDLPDTPADVEVADGGMLTKKAVSDLLVRFSNRADAATKRAWRRRRVSDYEVRVTLPASERSGRKRRRSRRGGGGGRRNVRSGGRRGMANLPHIHVFDIDAAEGDAVEVLNPRSVDDVTDQKGRSESYVVDTRKGVIKPNTSLFVPVGTAHGGSVDLEDARLRVTYRFGREPDTESSNYLHGDTLLVTNAPSGITDAVAMLTAARLIEGDQYGELVPSGGGDSPDLASVAGYWKDDAKSTFKDWGRP